MVGHCGPFFFYYASNTTGGSNVSGHARLFYKRRKHCSLAGEYCHIAQI